MSCGVRDTKEECGYLVDYLFSIHEEIGMFLSARRDVWSCSSLRSNREVDSLSGLKLSR
jgi:hypothetical protein